MRGVLSKNSRLYFNVAVKNSASVNGVFLLHICD
jgi:hypothetical protein